MDVADRKRGCLLGLACGDAVGTSVEFQRRGSFPPVTDMVGGGPFRLPVGAWTDDTSMALCLGTSLVEKGFDPHDQMTRYCDWHGKGYLSSTGVCFDIGNTVRSALAYFRRTGKPFSGPTSTDTAGNGCIMRLAPVPIFYHQDTVEAVRMAGESSRTTHGAAECVEACQLMAAMLCRAFDGRSKEDVLFDHGSDQFKCAKVRAIAEGKYRDKTEAQIRGSGYVIDCLEASAWCLLHSDDFRSAVLRAVNLGDDADTTGAVCGQLAGALYGEGGIADDWLAKLVMVDDIRALANRLAGA